MIRVIFLLIAFLTFTLPAAVGWRLCVWRSPIEGVKAGQKFRECVEVDGAVGRHRSHVDVYFGEDQ